MDLLSESCQLQTQMETDRQWLHKHAETGFDLLQTKEYVKTRLIQMGYQPAECGKSGLVATIGSGDGRTILLRADMDALPIREESDVPFACGTGNMHACGHDMHTAMLLGAAQLLKQHESDIRGTVKLMFQPAEEIFEGSSDMIASGVLDNPKVDAAMMIHVLAGMPIPTGTVLVSAAGVSAPAADYFTIRVQGKGCHGSAPQNGVDALTAAAHILIALQELQARELNASSGAVMTIGTMQGGTAGNAIADSAQMCGTIRTYDEETRAFLKKRLSEISQGIAAAFRAQATVEFGSGCPTLVNDAALGDRVYGILTELLGPNKVCRSPAGARGGGSEDFAYVSQQVPALMLALAAGEPGKGFPYPQHHPKVKFDESVLSTGAAVFTGTALQWLAEP